MKFDAFRVYQFLIKRLIALFVYRTVDVIALARLAVTVGDKRLAHIYAVARNYRRGGVVEVKSVARNTLYEFAEFRGGKRTRGDYYVVVEINAFDLIRNEIYIAGLRKFTRYGF